MYPHRLQVDFVNLVAQVAARAPQVAGDHNSIVMGEEGQHVHMQCTAVVAAVQAPRDCAAAEGWEPAPGEAQRLLGRAAFDVAAHACAAFLPPRR